MFSLFEVYILLVFITTLDVVVHVSLENINEKKKTYSGGCLVKFRQPGSKGGKR